MDSSPERLAQRQHRRRTVKRGIDDRMEDTSSPQPIRVVSITTPMPDVHEVFVVDRQPVGAAHFYYNLLLFIIIVITI